MARIFRNLTYWKLELLNSTLNWDKAAIKKTDVDNIFWQHWWRNLLGIKILLSAAHLHRMFYHSNDRIVLRTRFNYKKWNIKILCCNSPRFSEDWSAIPTLLLFQSPISPHSLFTAGNFNQRNSVLPKCLGMKIILTDLKSL